MEPPIALRKLASNYNLPLERSDRKFYRRYSIKIESHIRAKEIFDNPIDSVTQLREIAHYDIFDNPIDSVTQLREIAHSKKDYVRRERWTVNYYTNSSDTAQEVIDLVTSVNGTLYSLAWFPDHIDKNTLIRKKPTQFKYGVKLKSGVSKDRIRNFVDQHRAQVLLDKNTDLDLYPDEKSRMSYYANRRSDTWNHTYYRFPDETLKNYFMFSFYIFFYLI